jgi:aminodeoxychorismate lyase
VASPFAFVNGRFVPESEAVVSVLDRSFLYGDGVFETLYAQNGKPFRLDAHLDRLWQGATLLNLRVPFSRAEINAAAQRVLALNLAAVALLRLTLSRGVGLRGYSPRGADQPTLIITQHPASPRPAVPTRWRLQTASFRLPAGDRLAAVKSCNKLAQILARAEAEAAGADEAILLNTDGYAVEAAAGNLFFIQAGVVGTPPVISGILPGVTRSVVLELCAAAGLPTREQAPLPAVLAQAEGVFVTLSTLGVVAAASLDGQPLAESPLTARLQADYWALVDRECGPGGDFPRLQT